MEQMSFQQANVGAFLRSAGSEFQALGAKIVNESCPKF